MCRKQTEWAAHSVETESNDAKHSVTTLVSLSVYTRMLKFKNCRALHFKCIFHWDAMIVCEARFSRQNKKCQVFQNMKTRAKTFYIFVCSVLTWSVRVAISMIVFVYHWYEWSTLISGGSEPVFTCFGIWMLNQFWKYFRGIVDWEMQKIERYTWFPGMIRFILVPQ